MRQLSFLLEYNLLPLRKILRSYGHSVFVPYDKEIGLFMGSDDPEIVIKVAEQKEDLGIDRIIITKDTRLIKYLKTAPVKLIVLIDEMHTINLAFIKRKQLCEEIIKAAESMVAKTEGQMIAYVECSRFY